MCPDEGPIMGDSLKPAYVATGIVGEKRNWQCVAYGNHIAGYNWYKDDKVIFIIYLSKLLCIIFDSIINNLLKLVYLISLDVNR